MLVDVSETPLLTQPSYVSMCSKRELFYFSNRLIDEF